MQPCRQNSRLKKIKLQLHYQEINCGSTRVPLDHLWHKPIIWHFALPYNSLSLFFPPLFSPLLSTKCGRHLKHPVRGKFPVVLQRKWVNGRLARVWISLCHSQSFYSFRKQEHGDADLAACVPQVAAAFAYYSHINHVPRFRCNFKLTNLGHV